MSKPRTGAPKRVAVGLLAGSLAMFGVALAPTAGATASVTTSRLAGATRYGTAAAIAGDATFAAPTTAIVATGENFPDALAASSLAGANAPTPIILTQTDTYTTEAKAGLAALKGKGVTTVNIVGGTVAVSQAVQDAIKADGFTVVRTAGADRYATAAALATAANTKSASAPVGGFKTALIATGNNFPDALAGGPAAYANKLPLLLVTDTVPQATKDAIASLGIKKAVILGGTAVVSDAVKAQLDTLTGNPSDRLAGTNRFGTAAAVGDYEITTLGFPASAAVLATGNNFPDALAAGPLGGQNKAPIVLTASLPAESKDFLDRHSNTINKLFVSGGTAVIDDATVSEAKDAAQTTTNDTGTNQTATTRPELVSATVVKTVSTTAGTFADPAGTTVAYTFDEPVTGAASVPGSFHLYRYSTPNAPLSGTSSSVSGTDSKTINVLFGALTTTDNNATTGTAGITVATVDLGAVTGNGASTNNPDTNPEGAAALTSNGTAVVTAGSTSAPDLQSVGRFGLPVAAGNNRLVDFTFDQAANVQSATTGFHLVLTDATVLDCTPPGPTTTAVTDPGGGSAPGGNGTNTITVNCPVATGATFGGQPVSATNVARGYVDAGAVGTALASSGGGSLNPLEASNTPHTAAPGPDLVSATFAPGTGTQTVDTAIFTFDEGVLNSAPGGGAFVPSGFLVYLTSGAQVAGTGSVSRNSDNTSQISVAFPLGSLTNAVGASVLAGTVASASGTNPPNRADEVASSATSTTVAPGATAAPDLTGVLIAKTNNSFGQLATTSVLYSFDSNITSTVDVTKLFLHLSDGSRLVCIGFVTTTGGTVAFGLGSGNSAVPPNSAACVAYTFVAGQAGTNSGSATAAQVATGVLGTVNNGAVVDASGNQTPEGAKVTAGSNGTPAS